MKMSDSVGNLFASPPKRSRLDNQAEFLGGGQEEAAENNDSTVGATVNTANYEKSDAGGKDALNDSDFYRFIGNFSSIYSLPILKEEATRFRDHFCTMEGYGEGVLRILKALSVKCKPNIGNIAAALAKEIPNDHSVKRRIFEYMLLNRVLNGTALELCLLLEFTGGAHAGPALVESLTVPQIHVSKRRQLVKSMDIETAKSSIEFILGLLGRGQINQTAVATTSGFPKPPPEWFVAPPQRDDGQLIALVTFICKYKHLPYPENPVFELPASHLLCTPLQHFNKGRMELDDVINYVRYLVKEGSRKRMLGIVKHLANQKGTIRIARLFINEWNLSSRDINDATPGKIIPKELPDGRDLAKCNNNLAFHNYASDMTAIVSEDGWREAAETLRQCPFISIAVSRALDSLKRSPRLGAVVLYAKPQDKMPQGYVYTIQPTAFLDEGLKDLVFQELEEITGLPEKRLVIWKDDIFAFQEFAYLRSNLEKRWMIEVQRTSTGGHLLQVNELARKFTGKKGKFCKRASVSTWLGSPGSPNWEPLRHLSILCKMVMEYAIASHPHGLVNKVTIKLQKKLVEEEWPKKFKAKVGWLPIDDEDDDAKVSEDES